MLWRFKHFKNILILFIASVLVYKSLEIVESYFTDFADLKNNRENPPIIHAAYKDDPNKKISNSSREIEAQYPIPIDIVLIFTNSFENVVLQYNLKRCVNSLLRAASVPVRIHLIADEKSFSIGSAIIKDIQMANQLDARHLKLVFVSSVALASEVRPIVEILQEHFTNPKESYYRDFLFFFSLFLDRILPGLNNIILMDIDTVVKGDIAELNEHFSHFTEDHIMGIAPELSTVYRHILSLYRSKHPDTKLGSPLSEGGFPGYNSGVLLINIPKLRTSSILASYLNKEKLQQKVQKYSFHGTLGDQDLFTLIALDHPEIFYTLPCQWNRQLCEWWRDKGYEQVFDKYFTCQGVIKIHHGNCKSEIPPDIT